MCLEMREVCGDNDVSRISDGLNPHKILQLGHLAEIGVRVRYEIDVVLRNVPSEIAIEIPLPVNDSVTKPKIIGDLAKYLCEPCTGTFVMAKISIDLPSSASH